MRRRHVSTAVATLVVAGTLLQAAPSPATPFPGAPACPTFPADSFWHADVSSLPVHPQSSTWVASVGTTAKLKADFGSGTWDGGPIGIPFTTVAGTQPRVPVSFDYADESDPGPYPVPANAPIEGGPASSGDRHVLVVDRDACRLWELYSAYPQYGGTSWTAGSGATWDLRSNAMRPLGWTSGDAAGLPILPGLVRRDEVVAGSIDHAIRVTAPRTANAYVWPASHKAATGGASDPPMGSWFRLKASFDISGYSAENQVVLRALKKHGMVLADNGSSWFMSGAPDPAWNNDDLQLLRTVAGSAFEAVDVSSLKVSSTSYATAGGPTTTTTVPPATTTTTRPPPTTTTTTTVPATTTTTRPPTTTTTTRPPTTTTTRPPTTTTIPTANLVANPGFESGLSGWNTGDSRTSLARTCTVAHTGSCSAQIGRTSSTGEAVLDDSPNTVASSTAGATYTASAWVKVPVGRSVTLRIREYRGTSVSQFRTVVATGTGAWQQLTVACRPGRRPNLDERRHPRVPHHRPEGPGRRRQPEAYLRPVGHVGWGLSALGIDAVPAHDGVMDNNHRLLACLMGPCPECGNGLLEAVSDGELTNFVCPQCGSCWHPELDWVHRIDPSTCGGCKAREPCLTPSRPYGQPIRHG